MEVLALFPGAAALDVVHAHGDGVVVGVNHGAVGGVSEAALVLRPCAAAPLILPTHLGNVTCVENRTSAQQLKDASRRACRLEKHVSVSM